MAKESANSGFIKLYRSLKDWQHYGEPTIMAVFIELLLSVNYEDGWWQGLECERGATFISIRTMADDLKMSVNTIQRALKVLTKTGEIQRIKIFKNNTKTIINNFSKFQGCVSNFDTPTDTPTDTKQEYKEREEYIVVDNIAHTHEEIVKDMFKNQITIEQFCMNEGISVEQCRRLADEVLVEWELVGETHRTAKETKRHLLDHIRKKAQAMNVQRASLEERKAKFIAECKALVDQGFNRGEVAEFANYYSQPTADGRLLFETFKGWNTLTRFQLNQKRKSS